MRVIYVALKYDYGHPEQGYSFEHYNFYHSLLHMGHDILYFDFMTLMQDHGREWMNRRLLEVAKAEKPDLMFTVLFTDELDRAVVREISENTDTVTLNWFCDDHWRFDDYSRHWAPCFNWVVTTAQSALSKYERLGCRNVIMSQWACNPFMYRKLDLPLTSDVSFVGQPHGNRREIIQALCDVGINVRTYGTGWEAGRLSQEEMIRLFNQSCINLNLSNASVPIESSIARMRKTLLGWMSKPINMVPFGSVFKRAGRRCLSELFKFIADNNSRSGVLDTKFFDQIKARNFEIPGCGGFLLTGRADNLESYYEIGKEIVCFDDVGDLIKKVRYYLSHEGERAAIAQAGYQRTQREHTYVHRFNEIFGRLGLPCEPLAVTPDGDGHSGHVEEVR